jgi:hypothetical protein
MFLPYLMFLFLSFKVVSVGMPVVWCIMAAVLLSPLGKDVSSSNITRALLTVGSALVVGACASFVYLTMTSPLFMIPNGHVIIIVAMVAQIIGSILIIIALLSMFRTKKNENDSETVGLISHTDSTRTPFYG